jgi:hypothetical protein
MGSLLAFPFDLFEWTQCVLNLIMKNKKLAKSLQDKLKEFASKFLKSQYSDTLGQK